jgi:hypothetical protein
MRTFVRVLALIAVIGIGLLLLFGGALLILLQQCPQENHGAVSAPASDSAPLGEIGQILKATEGNEMGYWTCQMHPEVKAAKPGKCPKCGMRLVVVITPADWAVIDKVLAPPESNTSTTGALTGGVPSPADRFTPEDWAVILNARLPPEEAMQQKTISALISMVGGLVLTFSGIILAAVRPRQRQVVARPVLGNAAVLASMAQVRPAVAPTPGPMPEAQAPPSQPAAPTFQRAMPVSAAWKGRAMKNVLLIVGMALIGIGLLVSLVGMGHPATTAIIAGGVLILITGAGLAVAGQFLSRGRTPKR